MKLYVDKTNVSFTVTRTAEPRLDDKGNQRVDRRTNEPLFTVQLMALDEKDGEMLNVTVAGQAPKVTRGQAVDPVELEAIPWAQNGRNGVAFRATEIKDVKAASGGSLKAAS